MNTEDLNSITTNWQINDDNVKADPAKLKEAYETTQTEIASFWNEVDGVKKSDLSVGDQIRRITDLLTEHIQNLPLDSFETGGTFVTGGDGGEVHGIIYNTTDKSLAHAFLNDFHEKIWTHYMDRVQSIDDFWPLRGICFPVGYNFWESREKTNEANGKINQFLEEADLDSLLGFLVKQEYYSLQKEMPELYSTIVERILKSEMDLFLFTLSLAECPDEELDKLSGITKEQFDRLLANVQCAEKETKDDIMPVFDEFRSRYFS